MTDLLTFEDRAMELIISEEVIISDEQFSSFSKFLNNEGMKAPKHYTVSKVESGWLFKMQSKTTKKG